MINLRESIDWVGNELATPGSAVRHVTDCATRPRKIFINPSYLETKIISSLSLKASTRRIKELIVSIVYY